MITGKLCDEKNVDYVETDYLGNDTWVMKDGSHKKPPLGWTNEIPGGFKATKISNDGKTLI